ncbi:MAG TPA: PrsW family glutamic-type intramembrane protease [Vicinamibacterales bacterium]|jgi:RsiW-degrading membrane proteinase PrsW (M82 family)|nr:PrsW family glutamic-type intramembrane protease [Vicinamibacterales bacterium]
MAPYALALLPVLFFLVVLLLMDSFKLVHPQELAFALIGGALAALLSDALLPWVRVSGLHQLINLRVLAPAVEEILKGTIVVAILASRWVGFPVDAGIQGFAIGAGFALVENMIYIHARPGSPLSLWVVRGFGTAILHGAATSLFAMIALRLTTRRGASSPVAYLPACAAAIALHAGFNSVILPPFVQMLILLIIVPLLLIFVFDWSERATREWVGAGLDLDVELLDLVTSDAFEVTHFAQYLRELRARFPGPIVADMFCLLRLQLELSAQAKGKLIARSAGLELESDAETRAALEEVEYLRRSIGRTGLLALKPLNVTSDRDHWHSHLLSR